MSAPAPAPTPVPPESWRQPKRLPPLEPFLIHPSRILWRVQRFIHVLLALLPLGALWPYLFVQPVWWPVLLVYWGLILHSERRCRQQVLIPPRWLGCDRNGWFLEQGGRRTVPGWYGDAVVWQWLIVLRYRLPDGTQHVLVLLPDSATREDLRRLRVWLRTQWYRSSRRSD